MEQPLNIMYTCQCCYKQKNKMKNDSSGYYENKILGQGGVYRCTKCKEIKPVDNFSLVSAKKSKRRRKYCDDCRKKQLRERYYERKREKELKDKAQ